MIGLSTTVGVMLLGLHVGSTIHHRAVNEASRNAVVALHAIAAPDSAGAENSRARRSRGKAVAGAAKATLPSLLVVAAGVVYVFGIFAAYRAAATSWLKTIVYFNRARHQNLGQQGAALAHAPHAALATLHRGPECLQL